MRLVDLNPTFIKITDASLNLQENTDDIGEASGLTFTCPVCPEEKILLWQPKSLWRFRGSGYNDLTIESNGSFKIESHSGYCFTIVDGEIKPVLFSNVDQAMAVMDSVCANPALPSTLYDWQKEAWYYIRTYIKDQK